MATPDNSPHLKRVLCSYKSQAMNTLQGPGTHHILEARKDHFGGAYNFKKALIHDSFKRAKEDPCKKCDVEIVTAPLQTKGCSETPWQATITPCGDTPDNKPRVTKEEPKVILIKNDPKKPVSENGGRKWVEGGFMAPPFPPQQMPVLAAADPGVMPPQGRSETFLEGEPIACFYIGGEPRLCLPQILNTVLRNFSLPQINGVCDELQIFCSRCSPKQLDYLKDTRVLPAAAISCGLITKTDAQRLTHALFFANRHRPAPPNLNPEKHPMVRVSHNCFGKCKGIAWLDLYTSPTEPCIECLECSNLFNPMQFVCHAHKSLENRTCHWGFDVDNWRSYLMLSKDQNQSLSKAETELQNLRNKFDSANHKRKQTAENTKDETAKKVRSEDLYAGFDPSYIPSYMAWGTYTNGLAPAWTAVPILTKDGKQLPLPPPVFIKDSIPSTIPDYLSQGPPVLLDPARVVPLSETEKFERNFQPNVALAPLKARDKSQSPRDSVEKLKDEQLRLKSISKQIIYEKISVSSESLERLDKFVKLEPECEKESFSKSCDSPKSSTPKTEEVPLIFIKVDPDSFQQISPRSKLPPDLELSTTDSDTESVNSCTSKSEIVEEAEALLRGWTSDRAAAKKVLEIVASLAKSSFEKDKKLGEATKERARMQYTLQILKREQEARNGGSAVSDECPPKDKYSSDARCFQVKKEP